MKANRIPARKPNTFRPAIGMVFDSSRNDFHRVAALDINAGKRPSKGRALPARRMSMRKIKEVLRLRYELKLDQRQIAAVARSRQHGP